MATGHMVNVFKNNWKHQRNIFFITKKLKVLRLRIREGNTPS